MKFIRIALGGLLAEGLEAGFLGVVVGGPQRVVLMREVVNWVLRGVRVVEGKEYFVFLQDPPFRTLEWLGTLFVVAPLDGIAHG